MAPTIADFDRSTLGPKTRVHALAKMLGITSKELIVALDAIGLVKVAQSNLSQEEAFKLLDSLASATNTTVTQPEPTEPADKDSGETDTPKKRKATKRTKTDKKDKIRQRVEKNVANEIHQIEEKVERELSELLDSEPLDFEPEPAPQPEVHAAPLFSAAPIFLAPETLDSFDELEDLETNAETNADTSDTDADEDAPTKRKRRGRRGKGRGKGAEQDVDTHDTDTDAPEPEETTEPVGIKGSTRLEAQRRRRSERREEERKKRHIVSEAEFLARRESVDRTMVVREKRRGDHPGTVTQVAVLEDDLLVEHFVTSETQNSMVGNIYLGRVQNVLPSMEAAFIDIGKGRNGVLYAGEVDWKARGLGGRKRKIEEALKSGDQVLVQVSKDPVGQKGARLTTQISLAGRYLVYVPSGHTAGISRKLPETERKRLKNILKEVVPDKGGAIIRTAAEGVGEQDITADVRRLHNTWEQIQQRAEEEKNSKGAKPVTLYEEPDMLVKVIRDLFNEDFSQLIVDGDRAWNTVHAYIQSVAPDLLDRLVRYDAAANGDQDAFESYRVDEQLDKALARKVWLPSGGTLVIDRTEAMTVIDVNTGKFTGSGGDLEETITRNNLEAAEEIVRQMRLRDVGGMIVVDFIDMVLPENQDLVLRRLTEALGRDRTRHQVSEVTSLGLVQMTRKKLGTGLLETFSTECEHCEGRGIIIHSGPVAHEPAPRKHHKANRHPVAVAMQRATEDEEIIDAEVISEVVDDTAGNAGSAKPSIEELAAAVVVDTEPEPEPTRHSLRSRRRSNRKNKAVVETATDTAEASAAKPKQTYEEALAEFEASPRRRRATRGNSRSDVPPQPEDFVEPEALTPSAPVDAPDTQVGTSSRRTRRRAVRRSMRQSETSASQSTANAQAGREAAGREAAGASTSAPRGRGRRRAVRKRTAG